MSLCAFGSSRFPERGWNLSEWSSHPASETIANRERPAPAGAKINRRMTALLEFIMHSLHKDDDVCGIDYSPGKTGIRPLDRTRSFPRDSNPTRRQRLAERLLEPRRQQVQAQERDQANHTPDLRRGPARDVFTSVGKKRSHTRLSSNSVVG
jgi:hypothetical protein